MRTFTCLSRQIVNKSSLKPQPQGLGVDTIFGSKQKKMTEHKNNSNLFVNIVVLQMIKDSTRFSFWLFTSNVVAYKSETDW